MKLRNRLSAAIGAFLVAWRDPTATMNVKARTAAEIAAELPPDQREAYLASVAATLSLAALAPPPITASEIETGSHPATQRALAGALYDFMGFLTAESHDIAVGSKHAVGPLLEAFQRWTIRVGLPHADANVLAWRQEVGITAPRTYGEANAPTEADLRIAADWGTTPSETRTFAAGPGVDGYIELTPEQSRALDEAAKISQEEVGTVLGIIASSQGGFVKVHKSAPAVLLGVSDDTPHGITRLLSREEHDQAVINANMTEHQQRAAKVDWSDAPSWAVEYAIGRFGPSAKGTAKWTDGGVSKTEEAKVYFELRDDERGKLVRFHFSECQAAKHLQFQLQQMDRVGELPKDEQVTFHGVPVHFDEVLDQKREAADVQRAADQGERA